MKKDEFIGYIKNEFIGMHFDELSKLLEFFEQSIDDRIEDGMSEEDAVASLGDLNDIKAEFYTEHPAPTPPTPPNSPQIIQSTPSIGFEEKYIYFENTNQNIYIKDKNNAIQLELSNDNKIHIDYSETDYEYYEVSHTGNDIIMECKSIYNNEQNLLNKMYSAFKQSFSTQNRSKMLIRIPDDYTGKLNLVTSNAKIKLIGANAGNINLKTSNGVIDLQTVCSYDSVSAASSNAKIIVDNLRVTSKAVLKSSNSKIDLSNISTEYLEAVCSNGKIEADTVNALKDLSLITSNGNILVKDIWGGSNIELVTSNGNVSGNVIGNEEDFSVKLSTSNGKKSLKNNMRDTGRYLKVNSSNGNIKVVFTAEK